MRVLVIGAGVIGTVYAGLLAAAGHDTCVLARGRRLDELRRAGVRLRRADGHEMNANVAIVDELPDAAVDLVIVAVRREQAIAAARQAAHARSDAVMLFGNYAGMTSDLTEAVGAERAIVGFPGVGGRVDDDVLTYTLIRQQPTVVGKIGSGPIDVVYATASALREAGFPVTVVPEIEGWLSSHAALVVPMAAAIRAAGGEASTLADRADLLRVAVRATRAVYRAQRDRGCLVVDSNVRLLYLFLPEWLAVRYWSRTLRGQFGELAFAAHTRHAWDEMAALGAWLRSTLQPNSAAQAALDRAMGLAAR